MTIVEVFERALVRAKAMDLEFAKVTDVVPLQRRAGYYEVAFCYKGKIFTSILSTAVETIGLVPNAVSYVPLSKAPIEAKISWIAKELIKHFKPMITKYEQVINQSQG